MNRSHGTAPHDQPNTGKRAALRTSKSPKRMSRRRRLQVAGTMALLIIVTTACGSSDTPSASSAAASTTIAVTDATTSASKTLTTDATTTVVSDTTASTAATANTDTSSTTDATPAIVAAANAFLDTLTADERTAVVFDFSNTTQRQNWSNLPEGLYQRDGLMWGNLDDNSQQAWLGVLQAILSDSGYEQVYGEWHADDALAGGGGGLTFGSDYYWVAIIGEPSETDAWQFQFGGHHITVNATIKGSDISLTPSFIGVQPAVFDSDGNEIRPLGTIEDDAFAVVDSLDDSQISTAVLGNTLIDLVLGPGQDGKTIENQGIAGATLTDDQKTLLLTLIAHYGGLVNDEDAVARMAELTSEIDDTYFAWYGPTDPSDTSGIYFRVTGPSLVIEYSGQQMGGTASDHIHGMYRDPTNDYGAEFGAGLS